MGGGERHDFRKPIICAIKKSLPPPLPPDQLMRLQREENIINYMLSIICYQLYVINYMLSIICYQLYVINYMLSIICYQLYVSNIC